MELKHWFLELFLIHKVMPNFLIYPILLIVITSYIQLDDNILLSSYPPICILLYIKSTLMVPFLSFLRNVNLVFPMKSTVMAKETRLNKKKVSISLGFAYIKYKV